MLAAASLLYVLWRAWRSARAGRVQAETLVRLRITLARIDAMNDQDFEYALSDLLVRDGWTARRVGQQGDQAADVIGEHHRGGLIVLQAKHTKVGGKVGSHVMHQVKGAAGPVHRVDVAVVVTNGSFTRDAKIWGDRHQVHWVDRDWLRTWARNGTPLHDLLRLPDRPAGRTTRLRKVRPLPADHQPEQGAGHDDGPPGEALAAG
ncbi:restriction endonuclease [Streptomyces sp. NPDC002133]|uniref:restriction endonuclease n=1 Tax=Streptomyces sp. NPDC002133 TaxID=3154409 RepID=UPI00331EEC70